MRALRPVTRDEFGAGKIQGQECLDVFFHSETSNIEENRRAKLPPEYQQTGFLYWPEMLNIDAARPQPNFLKTFRFQFTNEQFGRDHRHVRGRVEEAQCGVGQPGRDERHSQVQIFRKARCQRSGERELALHADCARGNSQRSFGRDVQGVRCKLVNGCLHFAARQHGKADFRVGRQRDGLVVPRRCEAHLMTHRGQFTSQALQRSDDAIHLRPPGVGYDQDLHGTAPIIAAMQRQSLCGNLPEFRTNSALTSQPQQRILLRCGIVVPPAYAAAPSGAFPPKTWPPFGAAIFYSAAARRGASQRRLMRVRAKRQSRSLQCSKLPVFSIFPSSRYSARLTSICKACTPASGLP